LALEKPRNLAFRQNGGENYFRFRFWLHIRILHGRLSRNRHKTRNRPPHTFSRKLAPKLKNSKIRKTSYNAAQRESVCRVAAVAALYHCDKFYELLTRVNRLKYMRVFGLSRFSAQKATWSSGPKFRRLYLTNFEG